MLSLTNEVILILDAVQQERSSLITVEEVQDIVEQTLMNHGHYKIAKNYILYREKQTIQRQEKTLEKIKEKQLQIKVSESETIIYQPKHIEKFLRKLSEDLYKISIQDLLNTITKQVYDNIPMSEVNQIILNSTKEKIENHYEYSQLSARIKLHEMYESILEKSHKDSDFTETYQEKFKNYIQKGIELELLTEEFNTFNLDKIISEIKPERDFFQYLGSKSRPLFY